MITESEIVEFVNTWNKIKKESSELIRKQNWDTGWYPDGLSDITEVGLEFFAKVPAKWEDGDDIEKRFLSWDDLINYTDSMKKANANIEAHKKQSELAQTNWQRKQFEELKKKFEP